MIGREGLHRQVLLDLVTAAGGGDPVSYISTGNVTFDLDDDLLPDWIARTEAGLATVLGRPGRIFVRSIPHLAALDDTDPFADAPFGDEIEERTVSFLPDSGVDGVTSGVEEAQTYLEAVHWAETLFSDAMAAHA